MIKEIMGTFQLVLLVFFMYFAYHENYSYMFMSAGIMWINNEIFKSLEL